MAHGSHHICIQTILVVKPNALEIETIPIHKQALQSTQKAASQN